MEPIRVMAKTVPATVYNHVRLALLRIATPARIELKTHRGLAIILEKKFWHCVDTINGDQTVMVWNSFELNNRTAIHAPVKCVLSIYHSHAGLVMGSVLDELSDIVATLLRERADNLEVHQI